MEAKNIVKQGGSSLNQTKPVGNSIESCLRFEPCVLLSDRVENASQIIRGVHALGNFTPPFVGVHQIDTLDANGSYKSRFSDGQPEYLLFNSTAPRLEWTFIHEFGHYLDAQALCRPNSILTPGVMASEQAGFTSVWLNAIDASTLHQTLIQRQGEYNVSITVAGQEKIAAVDHKKLQNLLEPTELFAYSYVQFIAQKSQNSLLLNQVAQMREEPEGQVLPRQWADDDFVSIADTLETLFIKIGWMELV